MEAVNSATMVDSVDVVAIDRIFSGSAQLNADAIVEFVTHLRAAPPGRGGGWSGASFTAPRCQQVRRLARGARRGGRPAGVLAAEDRRGCVLQHVARAARVGAPPAKCLSRRCLAHSRAISAPLNRPASGRCSPSSSPRWGSTPTSRSQCTPSTLCASWQPSFWSARSGCAAPAPAPSRGRPRGAVPLCPRVGAAQLPVPARVPQALPGPDGRR